MSFLTKPYTIECVSLELSRLSRLMVRFSHDLNDEDMNTLGRQITLQRHWLINAGVSEETIEDAVYDTICLTIKEDGWTHPDDNT